jgi:hypothetical protein
MIPCSSKRQFATREIAEANAGLARLRAYRCPLCDGWHLSSQTKEQRRRRRRAKGVSW